MTFTRAQVEQMLKPIAPQRVLTDGKGHSHVSQQDVTAHLIRIFGFGNFDTEVIRLDCVYETERENNKGRWDVCYRALVRLIIRDPNGVEVCHYEDGSTGVAQNQSRGDAHDLAMKSALSLSKKRTAVNLGDQWGASLYNKGQRSALVIGTLVMPDDNGLHNGNATDLQEGIPQQVSMGNDETSYDDGPNIPAKPASTSMAEAIKGWES